MPQYLLDANIFIQAKNLHYKFSFCGGFWEWVKEAFNQKIVYSAKVVRNELNRGSDTDEVKKWANGLPEGFFLEDKENTDVMTHYGYLMNWASGNSSFFNSTAITEFANSDVADAFLIAAAKQYGYDLVTQETKKDNNCKRRITIPVAASQLNVNCINLYELLDRHACGTFAFRR